jgi:hypothetical protein
VQKGRSREVKPSDVAKLEAQERAKKPAGKKKRGK